MNYFLTSQNHAIVGLVALPEGNKGIRIYILWDWPHQVEQGIYSAFKSRCLYPLLTEEAVIEACDTGYMMSPSEVDEIFKPLNLMTYEKTN